MPRGVFQEFDYALVMGAEGAESIFWWLVEKFGVDTIMVHNQADDIGTVEKIAEHYSDGLGNLQATVLVPESGLAMSVDAYYELGCLFFDRANIQDLGEVAGQLWRLRENVSGLIDFHRARQPESEAVMHLWRNLKGQEDQKLSRDEVWF
jgi:hypothetical protein